MIFKNQRSRRKSLLRLIVVLTSHAAGTGKVVGNVGNAVADVIENIAYGIACIVNCAIYPIASAAVSGTAVGSTVCGSSCGTAVCAAIGITVVGTAVCRTVNVASIVITVSRTVCIAFRGTVTGHITSIVHRTAAACSQRADARDCQAENCCLHFYFHNITPFTK